MISDKPVVMVTGASSGIGEALAKEFVARGFHVALVARRTDRLKEVAARIDASARKTLPLQGDVSIDGSMEECVRQTIHVFGHLDTVVANAGYGVVGNVEDLKLSDFRAQLETNVFGVLRTFYACKDELIKHHGRFAIMGSVAGYLSFAGSAPYSMSKFAVRALADALRMELIDRKVSVTLISPGFVKSDIRKVDNQGKLHESAKDPIPDWIQMDTDKAAQQMVSSILVRKSEVVITGHGKAIVFLQRHFPSLAGKMIKLSNAKARSRVNPV